MSRKISSRIWQWLLGYPLERAVLSEILERVDKKLPDLQAKYSKGELSNFHHGVMAELESIRDIVWRLKFK